MSRHAAVILSIFLFALVPCIYAQSESASEPEDAADRESPVVYDTYIVQTGDTLSGIARRFGTTMEDLKAANAIADASRIIAGQVLLIPTEADKPDELYEVQPGDTLFSIAAQFNTSIGILQQLNALGGETGIDVGQRIAVQSAATPPVADATESEPPIDEPVVDDGDYTIHVVERGDTLFDLSRLYNTTVAQLRSLNDLGAGTSLQVGQSIVAPAVDETVVERYIVQSGDSLYSIARRYDVDLQVLQMLNRLADIRDLRADQAILVPILDGATFAIHVIQIGDTLEDIAETNDTSVELLQSLNGIADPSLIELGKTIIVPTAKEILARPGFGYGIQVFIDDSRARELAASAVHLGADWVKMDVSWAKIETAPNIYSYSALDSMIAAMELAGLKIMLTVYDAPAWSRTSYTERLNSQFRDYTGPPENYEAFADFLANLVVRYAGLVDAYEIWKSPNLLKFWSVPVYTRPREMTPDGDYGIPDEIQMGARYYVPLLEVAFDTIKSLDERAMVVTAGLAPVGFNDNYNSIDTVTFLNNMLQAGAASHSDAIGAVFSASAVPPTLACCDKPPGVNTHYESFLQYYGDLLSFYDETLKERGIDRPTIMTHLGWGTMDGANLAVPATGFEWLTYTSDDEQALYVTQAYRIAQKLDHVSAIFLYNLNGCAVGDKEACFFSLEDADGNLRPVYAAYQAVPKVDDA